jgi:hypothetical protein
MITLRGAEWLAGPWELALLLALVYLAGCLFWYALATRRRWLAAGGLVLLLLGGAATTTAVVTLRAVKGAALTHSELDANFTTLQEWIYTGPWSTWTLDPAGACAAALTTIPAAGGATYSTITCTDSASDRLYATFLLAPVGWQSSTLHVRATGVQIGAAPSGKTLGFTVSAQCIRDGVVASDTWGTTQPLTLAFTTQDQFETVETAAITPSGTCTGGTETAPVYVQLRLAVNTTNTVCSPETECVLVQLEHRFTRP